MKKAMETTYAEEIAVLKRDLRARGVSVRFSPDSPDGTFYSVKGSVFRVKGTTSWLAPRPVPDEEPDWMAREVEIEGALWEHEELFWVLAHEAGHVHDRRIYQWGDGPLKKVPIELSAWVWALAYAQTRGIELTPRAADRCRRALATYYTERKETFS